jgi:hypothetical protein
MPVRVLAASVFFVAFVWIAILNWSVVWTALVRRRRRDLTLAGVASTPEG